MFATKQLVGRFSSSTSTTRSP